MRLVATGGQWDGFWCLADGRHYTRCIDVAGGERWFRIADDAATARLNPRRKRANGIPFPASAGTEPRMIVGRYRGKAMLVGARRRRERGAER